MANRHASNLGLEEALSDRGKFFWRAVTQQLADGQSLTQIAASTGSTFNELWDHFRRSHQMSRYIQTLTGYLERETDADSGARLVPKWNTIVKSYTSKFKKLSPKAKKTETPEMLGIRWGIKPSLIEKRLRDAGLMESITAMEMLLAGSDIDVVVEGLLDGRV